MVAGRNPFTEDDQELLTKYIAVYNPGLSNRRGNALYKQLVENPAKKWAWGGRHSWQSWRDQYVKHAAWYDHKISKYQKKHNIKAVEPIKGFKLARKPLSSDSSDTDTRRATKRPRRITSDSSDDEGRPPTMKARSAPRPVQSNTEDDSQDERRPRMTKSPKSEEKPRPQNSPPQPAYTNPSSHHHSAITADSEADKSGSEPDQAPNRGSVPPNEYSGSLFTQEQTDAHKDYGGLFTQDPSATQNDSTSLFTEDEASGSSEAEAEEAVSGMMMSKLVNEPNRRNRALSPRSIAAEVQSERKPDIASLQSPRLATGDYHPSHSTTTIAGPVHRSVKAGRSGVNMKSTQSASEGHSARLEAKHPAPNPPESPSPPPQRRRTPPKFVERPFGGSTLMADRIRKLSESSDEDEEDLRPNWPAKRSRLARRRIASTAELKTRNESTTSDPRGKAEAGKANADLKSLKSEVTVSASAMPSSSRVTLDFLPTSQARQSDTQLEKAVKYPNSQTPTPVIWRHPKPVAAPSSTLGFKPTRLMFDSNNIDTARLSGAVSSHSLGIRRLSESATQLSSELSDDNPFLTIDANAHSDSMPNALRRHTFSGIAPNGKPKTDLRIAALRHSARHSSTSSKQPSDTPLLKPELPSSPATDEDIIEQMGREAALQRLKEYWGFDEELTMYMYDLTGTLIGADRGLCFVRMRVDEAIREYAEMLEAGSSLVDSEPSARRKRLLKTPSRRRRLALQITPTRLVDEERAIPYVPPETSRAGRFAQLTSEGRLDEAMKREMRRASRGGAEFTPLLPSMPRDAGKFRSLTPQSSPEKYVLTRAMVGHDSENNLGRNDGVAMPLDGSRDLWGDDEDDLVCNARRPDEDKLVDLGRRVGELYMREKIIHLFQTG